MKVRLASICNWSGVTDLKLTKLAINDYVQISNRGPTLWWPMNGRPTKHKLPLINISITLNTERSPHLREIWPKVLLAVYTTWIVSAKKTRCLAITLSNINNMMHEERHMTCNHSESRQVHIIKLRSKNLRFNTGWIHSVLTWHNF